MVKTYADLFLDARRALLKQEGQFAANVARELVCAASGKSAEQIIADRELYASEEVCELTESFVQRRLRGEPMPYILGQWDFYGMTLTVTPDVLIPRDDTVVVTELAIKKAMYLEQNPRILDLCTGSGCIGLAIAKNAPGCHAVLGELDEGALRVCRQNIRRNDLTGRVVSLQLDAREKPPAHLGEFDCIVSNPPYIPDGDIAGLDVSVRDYEPHLALKGGADGLDFYRDITRLWTAALRVGGRLLFEVGIGQADEVLRIMRSVGFGDLEITPDLNGIPRVVEGVLHKEL